MNYLVLLMIGTSDTAFLRINNIAFWLLVLSLLFAVLSTIIDEGLGTGWTVKKGYAVLKCHSMRETPLYNINLFNKWIYYIKVLKYKLSILYNLVKKFNMIGQYASIFNILQRLHVTKLLSINNSHDLKKQFHNFLNKLSKIANLNMDEWLVGLTDGDGTFNVYTSVKNQRIIFTYKISLTTRNTQLLYKIKNYLGYGNVDNIYNNMIDFKIRDKTVILNKIILIFDKYLLLTTKRFNYLKFKECLLISNNINLTQSEKIIKIQEIYNKKLEEDYISDAWNLLLLKIDLNLLTLDLIYKNILLSDVKLIMSKSWLIGFIEAEGSFYLVDTSYNIKNNIMVNHFSHSFGITQKLDYIVLLSIKLILNIKSNIRKRSLYNKSTSFFILETKSQKTITYIINYFISNSYESLFLGMKSFEFRIWTRSFNKYKKDFSKLLKVRQIMRKYRLLKE